MNLHWILIILAGVVAVVLTEDGKPKATTTPPATTTKADDKDAGESVGTPLRGGYGFGSGSRTYYHDSYKRGGGFGHGHGYGHGHGFGYGHHHGHGHYGHRSHYTHISSSSSGFLGAAHGQQQQEGEPIVGSTYPVPGPRIPCPQNVLITCQPTVAPVSCSGSY